MLFHVFVWLYTFIFQLKATVFNPWDYGLDLYVGCIMYIVESYFSKLFWSLNKFYYYIEDLCLNKTWSYSVFDSLWEVARVEDLAVRSDEIQHDSCLFILRSLGNCQGCVTSCLFHVHFSTSCLFHVNFCLNPAYFTFIFYVLLISRSFLSKSWLFHVH